MKALQLGGKLVSGGYGDPEEKGGKGRGLTLTRPSMESYDLHFTEEEMRLRWAGFLAPGLTAPVRPA